MLVDNSRNLSIFMDSNISKENLSNQDISGRRQVFAKNNILEKYLGLFSLAVIFFAPFYIVRFKSGFLAFNLVEILIMVCFLVWIVLRFQEKKLSRAILGHPFLKNNYYFCSIVLILTGLAASLMAGGNYYVSLGIIKGWFLLPIVFSFVLYDIFRRDENGIKKYFIALFLSGVLVSFLGMIYWFRGILTYDGRLNLFYDSPNQLAMTLAPAFLIGIVLSLKLSLRKQLRLSFSLGLLLIALNLYLTKSYGAWLAIGLTLITSIWLKYRKILPRKYLFVMIIILIIIVSAAGFGKAEDIKNLGSRSSLASRVMIWKSALKIGGDNPVFGIGAGNFNEEYLKYQKYFPPYLEWSVPQPHNLFLAFWLEAGALGLLGFLILVAKFFYDNIKKAVPRNREMALVCFAIMLYFLLHGLVDTTYWKNDSAIVFWVVISVNAYLARKTNLLNPAES